MYKFKIILMSAVLALAGCATAQRGALSRAYSKVEDGKYEGALNDLSRSEKYTSPSEELQAEIAFLRGHCYEALSRLPEAIGSYQYLIEHFPNSIYAYQAKAKLEALERSRAPRAQL
jgi:outer membrane protein assembly factor BamD (BamD/ComL family)